MASRAYFSAVDATEVTNTDSANYTDGLTLTFTPNASKDYVVFWSCLGQLAVATESVMVRLFETSERVLQQWESKEVTSPIDWRPFGGMYNFTSSGSPSSMSFKIQVKREASTGTARAKAFSIVALELAANDVITTSTTRVTTTSTSAVTKVTMNITPPSTGDYDLIYSANVDATGALSVEVNALVDGSTVIVDTDKKVAKDTTDRMPWARLFKKTGWTNAAHTAAITYDAGDAGTVGIAEARILALRLDGFDAEYYAATFTGATTTNTTYQDRVTLTQNPTAAGDHLIIAIGDSQPTDSATVSSLMDFTEDGAVWQETANETPVGSVSDEVLMPVFLVRDLTAASHTWKLRAKSETTSVATFSNGSIAVLQVESSSLAVTMAVTEAPDGASLAITAQTGVTIAATEAADIAAIAIGGTELNVSLAATEAADTAALAISAQTGVTLAATEAKDTAALTITAQTGVTLAATEATDTAALAISAQTGVSVAATEAQDAAALALTAQTGVTLAAIEAQDSAAFSLSSGTPIILSATEAQDIAALTVSAQTGFSIAATEAQDAAAIAIAAAGGTLVMTVATMEAADIASFNLAYWKPIPDHSDIWVVQPPDGGIWTVVPPEHVT